MKTFRKSRLFKPFIWLMIPLLLYACNFYRTKWFAPSKLPTVADVGKIYKHFIIHDTEGNSLYLENIEMDSVAFHGTLVDIPEDVIDFNLRHPNERGRYKPATEASYVHQVHLYLAKGIEINEGKIEIPLTQLTRIKVMDKNTGRTILSYALNTLGVLAIIYVIILIIALLTKSSCPYVYVHDGEDYRFQGEIYGGAILHNLERDDYLPLPHIRPVGNDYKIRISNELKERQFTNLAHLLVVDHTPGTQVLLDGNGKAHVLQNPQPPDKAYLSNGLELPTQLHQKDSNVYMFDDPHSSTDGLILEFERPDTAVEARLLLNAKNSMWLEYMFGKFSEKFGGAYPRWIERQKEESREVRSQRVIDQDFMLSVFIEKAGEWKLVERIPTIGPLASRDMVVPVSLEGIQGESVKIRLTTGYMFWDLDQVIMDFATVPALEVKRIMPKIAINSENQDYTHALSAQDDQYMVQTIIGEQTEISYPSLPAMEGKSRSVFLHSRGYYEHVREYEGLPDIGFLQKFQTPGHFHTFSIEEYNRVNNKDAEAVVAVSP